MTNVERVTAELLADKKSQIRNGTRLEVHTN